MKLISILYTHNKYKTLEYAGNKYLSCAYKSELQCCITLAHHTPTSVIRPVLVNFFVKMSFYHNNLATELILACVLWLHDYPAKTEYGSPLQIWWKDMYEPNLPSFIPIQWLLGNCAYMDSKYDSKFVLLKILELCSNYFCHQCTM